MTLESLQPSTHITDPSLSAPAEQFTPPWLLQAPCDEQFDEQVVVPPPLVVVVPPPLVVPPLLLLLPPPLQDANVKQSVKISIGIYFIIIHRSSTINLQPTRFLPLWPHENIWKSDNKIRQQTGAYLTKKSTKYFPFVFLRLPSKSYSLFRHIRQNRLFCLMLRK